MNHMIDADDGSHPFSPYYNPKKHQDDEYELILCSLCEEFISEFECIKIENFGPCCPFCVGNDKENASELLDIIHKETGGDLSHEESYQIRNQVRFYESKRLLSDFDSAKRWFTNFNEDLYTKIKILKSKQL